MYIMKELFFNRYMKMKELPGNHNSLLVFLWKLQVLYDFEKTTVGGPLYFIYKPESWVLWY